MRYISFIYYIFIISLIFFNSSYSKQETNVGNIKIKCACNKNNKLNNSNNTLNNNNQKQTVLPKRNISFNNSNVLHSKKNIKWVKVKLQYSVSQVNLHPKSHKIPDISNRKLKNIT